MYRVKYDGLSHVPTQPIAAIPPTGPDYIVHGIFRRISSLPSSPSLTASVWDDMPCWSCVSKISGSEPICVRRDPLDSDDDQRIRVMFGILVNAVTL